MKILLEKYPVVAGLSGKIQPDSMQRSGKSGSGRILKMLIRYTPTFNSKMSGFSHTRMFCK